MGHGKETPRQKMIGMMYLVLMAMLALNVSNQVLDAFGVLDDGLSKTKHSIEQTNELVFANFASQYKLNEQKVGQWFNKAELVKSTADSLVSFIQDRKIDILNAANENISEVVHNGHIDINHVNARDNTDAPAIVMIGSADDKAGQVLMGKMKEFKDLLLDDIISKTASSEITSSIKQSLSTDRAYAHGDSVDWTRSRFEHLPQAGVLAIMTGIQINVRNAEAEALKYLYNKIDEGTFKFTNLDATVIPNSNYIIKGNQYEAEVFIAARDSTATPRVYVAQGRNPFDSVLMDDGSNRYRYIKNKNLTYTTIEANQLTGKAVYKQSGSSLGSKYWGGIIELIGSSGDTIRKPFRRSYMVAEGAVTVAPTKMNVFYVGVDNPIDVTVAGVRSEDVSIQITNGKAKPRGKKGSYVVNPRRPGNSFVTVYANIDGKKSAMGKKEFRVKRLPDPIGKVNGIKGGGIAKQVLLAQVGVAADLEDFLFDAKYRVTKFTVSATIGSFRRDEASASYKFTPAQKQIIQSLTKGQRVYIEDIKAIGPDGVERSLPAISLMLK